MKIAVSRCLLGGNCKYNGRNNDDPELHRLLQGHEVITVCPEVRGGLPVPRDPCEIVNGRVCTAKGVSCDDAYRRGARLELESIRRFGAQLAILQARSPSCGVRHVYDGTFSGTLISGSGIFARLLKQEGIMAVDTEAKAQLKSLLTGKC